MESNCIDTNFVSIVLKVLLATLVNEILFNLLSGLLLKRTLKARFDALSMGFFVDDSIAFKQTANFLIDLLLLGLAPDGLHTVLFGMLSSIPGWSSATVSLRVRSICPLLID